MIVGRALVQAILERLKSWDDELTRDELEALEEIEAHLKELAEEYGD